MKRLSVFPQSVFITAFTTIVCVTNIVQRVPEAIARPLQLSQTEPADGSLLPLLMIDAQQSDITVLPTPRPVDPTVPLPGREPRPGDMRAVEEGVILREFLTPSEVRAVRVDASGRVIASGDDEDEVQLWDLSTGEPLHTWLDGSSERTQAVEFFPDGRRLVAGGVVEGRLRLWDWTADSRLLADTPLPSTYSVDVSPDGSMIATGHSGGVVNLWTRELELVRSIPVYEDSANVVAVTFSPDGSRLATRGTSRHISVKLLEVSTGRIVKTFLGDASGGVDSIAYSPDGNILAGYYDGVYVAGTVRLWNLRTGGVIADLQTNVVRPHAIAFSADGELLAVAGLSDLIEVWSIQDQEVVQTFTSGLKFHHVYSIDFAPDSRTFVTSGVAGLPDAEVYQGTIMTWALACDDIDHEASQALTTWAETTDVQIDRVVVYPNFDGKKEIEIFYSTDEDLQQFNQDGTSAQLRADALSVVEALDCYEAETLDWEVSFQSFDYILENYRGSYQFYYQR